MERVKRRWWTLTVTVLASVVVLGAVLSGLFQLAVMALPGYREQISGFVSNVAKRQVDIGGVALGWRGLAPRLELTDIVLYADDGETPALSAQRLRIGLGLLRLLRGDSFPEQVELSGLRLVVEIDRDDRVRVRGFDTAGASQAQHDWSREIARFDGILLEDCEIVVDDARLGSKTSFLLQQASARRRIGGAVFEASIDLPPAVGDSMEVEGSVEGNLEDWRSLEGRWSMALDDLVRLPWLDVRLPGQTRVAFERADLTLAGGIEQGRFDSVDVQIEAARVSAQRGTRKAQLRDIDLTASARREARAWTLEVPRLRLAGESGSWPATRLRLRWNRPAADQPGGAQEFEADADYLRLQDLVPWLLLSPDKPLQPLQGLSGEVRGLVARLRTQDAQPPVYSVRAQLAAVALAAQPPRPGFSGLNGELSASESGGRVLLVEGPLQLQHARLFAAPVAFERLSGELQWQREAAGLRLLAPAFSWQLAGAQGRGRLDLLLPGAGESPLLKLQADFSGEDATRLKPYMPLVWGEHLRNWLNRAILGGRVPAGSLRIEGRLADYPFRDGNGVFAVLVDVVDGKLAYAPGWPVAEQAAARLEFRGGGLSIRGDGARVLGNRVTRVSGDIPDFRNAVLGLDIDAEGEAARFYDFLRASPLAPRLSGLLDRTQASGPAAATVHIEVPLRDAKQTQVRGVARLKDAELLYQGLDEPFRGIRGDIGFDLDGASADHVTGSLHGIPVSAALYPRGKGATRLEARFQAGVQADGGGVTRYVPALLRPRLSGSAAWTAEALLGAGGDGVHLRSDLRGVAVDLPAPLGKQAADAAPIDIHIGGDAARPLRVTVGYLDTLGADVVFERNPATVPATLEARRVLLRLGSAQPPEAREPGLRVTGQVADLDLVAWVAALVQLTAGRTPGAGSGLQLQAAELQVQRLHLAGHAADDVRLDYRPEPQGWTTLVGGAGAEGQLRWHEQPTTQLVGRFTRLRLGAREKTAPEPTDPSPPREPLDPNRMPILDLSAENFALGAAQMGRVKLLTARTDGGQRLQTLEAGGAELDLKASGEWLRRGGASMAQLDFEAESRSIDELLKGLGYADNLQAERSRFKGRLAWPLAAAGLDWQMAQGPIDVHVQRGSLRAVEPGAGRVLGLMNFYALPRRLTLDFSDVVSKGLGFDQVKGRFDLAEGDAVTRDLVIEAPSLKMEVRGRVGLAARDYDEKVTVYPDVSSGLTLGALLLGGPAAAAIALVAQEVLDKPLDQVTQFSYEVTGGWDNPQVRRAGEPAVVAPPAQPGKAPKAR